MIRTSRQVPYLGPSFDPHIMGRLATPERLTTARLEPILRYHVGYGHLDLLFEDDKESCVVAGLALDGEALITRERSPFVWPAAVASAVDHAALSTLELRLLPWLRSLARARGMTREAIRRFAPSARFDRARRAGLPGAAPLEESVVALGPFVFARRFARGARIRLTCSQAFLGWAALADLAAAIECRAPANDDEHFARDWFGLPGEAAPAAGRPDIIIANRDDVPDAAVVIAVGVELPSDGMIMDVQVPTPWDLMYPFDRADAPIAAQFSVTAVEPLLRPERPALAKRPPGTSSGSILVALSTETLATAAADADDVQAFVELLRDEGFTVHVVSDPNDSRLASAGLLHIVGAPYDAHVTQFASAARECGRPYVFDLPPTAANASGWLEKMLTAICRRWIDDAEIEPYLTAYLAGRLVGELADEALPEEVARRVEAFATFAGDATAIVSPEADIGLSASTRIFVRGAFAPAEAVSVPIGHLVPSAPFALIHDSLYSRSHALFTAIALEQAGIPLVIAGPVYDVDYLLALRIAAPSAVILADADAGSVAALYRSAKIWIDAAPRPRSVGRLLRAVAAGALPVLAAESPLARIAGELAPTFALASFDNCGAVVATALAAPDVEARIGALRMRLEPLADRSRSFAAVMAAYMPAAIPA